MSTVTFSIDEETGEMTFLVNSITQDLAAEAGSTRRASHVEPMDWKLKVAFRALRWALGDDSRIADWTRTWKCLWQVDLSPVGGKAHGWFSSRADAIDYEIMWLNENFL